MSNEKLDYIENIRLKLLNNERLTDAEFRSVISALYESKECFQEPYYELVYHDKYDRVERRIMQPVRSYTYKTDEIGVTIKEDMFDLKFRRIIKEGEQDD